MKKSDMVSLFFSVKWGLADNIWKSADISLNLAEIRPDLADNSYISADICSNSADKPSKYVPKVERAGPWQALLFQCELYMGSFFKNYFLSMIFSRSSSIKFAAITPPAVFQTASLTSWALPFLTTFKFFQSGSVVHSLAVFKAVWSPLGA